MINLYKEIKEYYDTTLVEGYNLERFKSLPFYSTIIDLNHLNSKALVITLNEQISELSNSVTMIKGNIESEEYSNNYNTIKAAYSQFKREKNNHFLAKIFSNDFSQLVTISDEVGFDSSSFVERLDKVSISSKSSFSFLEKMAEFINEYVQLEPYIKKSMYDKKQLSLYIEELKDVSERYADVIDSASGYLRINAKDIIKPHIEEFNTIKSDMLAKLKQEHPEALSSISELYHNDINSHSGDLAVFMVDKKYEEQIVNRITLSQSQKIQDFIIFADTSVCYKKGGEYKLIVDNEDYKNVFDELEHSIIAYQLRKKPKMSQYISKLYKDSFYDFSGTRDLGDVLIVIDTYLQNEQILKNMKIDLTVFETKSFEGIDDYMHELINQHKLHQYANSILSNKNKNLLNDQSLASFKVLMESGVSKSVIQNLIGKKLSAISTPAEFESYLEKVVAHISGFNEDVLLDKLKGQNIEPVYKENNVIVFEVDTFEQSKLLGSPSWCIARSSHYFDEYKSADNKQYFLYDFNRNEKDNESMIGFTVKLNGEMVTQHSRDDDYHEVDDFLNKIIDTIIYTYKDKYKLSEIKLKKLENEFNPSNKNNSKKVLSV